MASSILIDGQKLDLFDRSEVTVTFQSNDIGQLKDVQVDFSKSFDVPKTPPNIKLLGNPNQPNISEGREYDITDITILLDGYLSLPLASMQIVSTDTVFKVHIQAGGVSFYMLSSKSMLNDPAIFNWSQYDTKYDPLTNILPATIGDDTIVIQLSTDAPVVGGTPIITYEVSTLYVSMLVSTILDNIVSELGYTFTGLDLPWDMYFSLNPIGDAAATIEINRQYSLNFQEWAVDNTANKFVLDHPSGAYNPNFGNWDGDDFTFTKAGTYEFWFTTEFTEPEGAQSLPSSFSVTMPDGSIHDISLVTPPDNLPLLVEMTVGVGFVANVRGTFGIFPPEEGTIKSFNTVFSIQSSVNTTYIVQDSMAEWSVLDFLKELARIHGKLFLVDSIRKNVSFISLEEINANRANSVDLSKTGLYKEPELSYIAGDFGIISRMQYSGDTPRPGELHLNNEWAPVLVDIWTAKSSGLNPNLYIGPTTDDPYSFFVPTANPFGPTVKYILNDAEGTEIDSITTSENYVPVQSNWVTIIVQKYAALSKMMQAWVQVKLTVYLSAAQVRGLVLLAPVYWDSRYWYVNEVSDFKIGTPTEITLIRLPL